MDQPRALRRRLLTISLGAILWTTTLASNGQVAAAPFGASDTSPTVLAAPTDAHIRLRLIASGLSNPVYATSANDGSGRIFIVEKTGRIKILQNGVVRSTPFLNISSEVSKGSEQGLLGLAFHPSFKNNRKLYVNFTNLAGNTVIREYRVSSSNPNIVSTSTKRQILSIAQPFSNHNGGMLAFGPDGYLYIGMGDGGDAGDPGNRAQSTAELLGKMLRIGINQSTSKTNYVNPGTNPYVGVAGRDEIWQIGLRNPWRFSFDKTKGDLWIGDVGQGSWEEVDRAVLTSSGPGRGVNWGWRVLEGTHCYSPMSGCSSSGKTKPLLEYDHGNGRCAITGGYVYRGSAIPLLRGGYVFGDYCSGEIWVVASSASPPASKVRLLDTNLLISSFGEIGGGELVVTDLKGRLYRLERA